MKGKPGPQSPKDSLTSGYKCRVNQTQQKHKDAAAAHSLFHKDIPDDENDSAISDYVSDNVCSVGTEPEMIL